VYTKVKNLKSVDILAVTIDEISGQELCAFDDPSTDGPSPEADVLDEAHALIDFKGVPGSNGKSKRLKNFAVNRGSLL
jgi:hypothetical protein